MVSRNKRTENAVIMGLTIADNCGDCLIYQLSTIVCPAVVPQEIAVHTCRQRLRTVADNRCQLLDSCLSIVSEAQRQQCI